MPQPTVYSFANIYMVIEPSGLAAYTVNGKGVGEISITYANDNTTHDLAADGQVMVSKVLANNGSISITVQQTSPLHQYLKGTFNDLMGSNTPAWAGIKITISSPDGTGDNIVAVGCSFTKRADQPFQQQGQRVTWNFMAADIQANGSRQPQVQASVSARIII